MLSLFPPPPQQQKYPLPQTICFHLFTISSNLTLIITDVLTCQGLNAKVHLLNHYSSYRTHFSSYFNMDFYPRCPPTHSPQYTVKSLAYFADKKLCQWKSLNNNQSCRLYKNLTNLFFTTFSCIVEPAASAILDLVSLRTQDLVCLSCTPSAHG